MKRLRSRRCRQVLQQIAGEVAYEVIGLPPEAMIKPMDVAQRAVLSIAKNADHEQDEQMQSTISHAPTAQEERRTDTRRVLPA